MSEVIGSEANISNREIDQRLVELQSLFEMSQVLNSSLQLKSVLNNILLTPMGRMMISRGFVMVADEGGAFRVEAVKGLNREVLGKQFYFECAYDSPILVSAMEGKSIQARSFFEEQQIELVLPITSNNRPLGVLCLGKKLGGQPFQDSEIDFLSSLSNIAATAIENALVYRKLESVNRQLDKRVQELKTLFEISQELNSTLDKERIVNLLAYAIMGELLVNRIFIFVQSGDGLELVPTKGSNRSDPDVKKLSSRSITKELAKFSQTLIVEEALLPKSLHLLEELDISLAIPMRSQEETRGMLLLGPKVNGDEYRQEELDFLVTLSSQAMIAIENARLFEETLEKQRLEEELNIAREIQQRLLPSTYPSVNGYEIKGVNIPSRQVGGDYFDVIRIDDHRIGLAIADVSGKGVPASLLMSNLQASLHSQVAAGAEITKMTGNLNNFLQAHTSYDKFITFFYAELDTASKSLTYVNAGHNPPYLYHSDGTFRTLDKGGLILGMMANMPYESETVSLQKGDLVVLFTDGVTEAKSKNDSDFEEWRLEKLLQEIVSDSVDEIIERIISAVQEFSAGVPQADDITVLALRVTE